MIDRNQIALMGVIVGTFGLVVGLGSAPAGMPMWGWVGLAMAPFLAMFLGGGLVNDSGSRAWRSVGVALEILGGLAYVVLFGWACTLAWVGSTGWWFLGLAPLGLVPALLVVIDALGRLQGRRTPPPDLFAAGHRLRTHKVPSPLDALRVIGAAPPLLMIAGGAFLLAGLFLFWLRPDDPDRFTMLFIGVFFSGAIAAGGLQWVERWRTFVRPDAPPPSPAWIVAMLGLAGVGSLGVGLAATFASPFRLLFAGVGSILLFFLGYLAVRRRRGFGPSARLWIAQEGIVEESGKGMIVFPWGRVAAFDLAALHGRPVVRIWFTDGASLPFHVLGVHGSPAARERWISRRSAALERSRRWAGADLLLQTQSLPQSPGAVFAALRRVSNDPASVVDLPSVLDNPPALDLCALGLGRVDGLQVDA